MSHLATLLLVIVPIAVVFYSVLSNEGVRTKVAKQLTHIFEDYE